MFKADIIPKVRLASEVSDLLGRKGISITYISVRIKRKSDISHSSIRQFLLELIPSIFDLLARGLDSIYADTNMAKAFARLRIAISNLEVFIILSAIIMRELQHALTSGPVRARLETAGRVVGQEVKIEFVVRVFDLVDLFHAQHLVVFDLEAD